MISRRWIINFFLVVLIILFTYVGNRFDVRTGYQPEKRISSVRPDDVDAIEIRTADTTLQLARTGNGWSIESPIRWPANNINVERVLDIVNSETDSRLGKDDIDLAKLGLDFPRALVRLNDTVIAFGETNNIGGRRYTQIGDEVFLLPDAYLAFISQGLIGLVDRRLLPPSLALTSLRLDGLDLERGADGGWQADDSRFSTSQAGELIANWQGLQANRVAPYRAASTPRQKLHARLEDGSGLDFYLMSIDPEVIVANPQIGLQYHFRADSYYQLLSLRNEENPA